MSVYWQRSYKELVQQHRLASKIVGGASCPALSTFAVIALRFYMSHWQLCVPFEFRDEPDPMIVEDEEGAYKET